MTDMIDGIDKETSLGWGDLLQAPQEWCYRQWEHLTFAPASIIELGKTIGKVCFLVIATPPCFLLGGVGGAFKFFANRLSGSTTPISPLQNCKIVFRGIFNSETGFSTTYRITNPDAPLICGSKNITEKTYRFDHPLRSIVMDSFEELEIIIGEENSLVITAEDNLFDVFAPTVSEDKITFKTSIEASFETHSPVKYRLTITDLREVTVLGGKINIPQLTSRDFKCRIEGGHVSILDGHVDQQEITLSKGGIYNALNLNSNHSKVTITGTGKARVWAEKTLDVNIDGAGVCTFVGDPQITHSISELGELNRAITNIKKLIVDPVKAKEPKALNIADYPGLFALWGAY